MITVSYFPYWLPSYGAGFGRMTANVTVHRRWAALDPDGTTLAALGFDLLVVDKLLAHQPAKSHGAASVYQRHHFAR
jgi:hypothetical protein